MNNQQWEDLNNNLQLLLDNLKKLNQDNPLKAVEQAKINLLRSGLAEIVYGEFRIKQLIQEKYYDRRTD